MQRVVILGAGFGGLELATMLSEALGDDIDVTLIDKSDAFVFGYSKLDVMFGRTTPEAVRLPYREFAKPGVRFLQETITAIDPEARRVTTDAGVHEADVLVVALGADYDFDATPGLAEAGNEFYSVAGAERLARGAAVVLARPGDHRRLRRAVQVPARAERGRAAAARLPVRARRPRRLRDLVRDPVRHAGAAVAGHLRGAASPPSPSAASSSSPAVASRSLDGGRSVAVLDDGGELPYDLFLGVPKHRAPDVVIASGMTEDGYVPVNPQTLETRFPGVYAVGDVATIGVPKAGVFAEGAARVVAASLIATRRGGEQPERTAGAAPATSSSAPAASAASTSTSSPGRSRPAPSSAPSAALVAEKQHFGVEPPRALVRALNPLAGLIRSSPRCLPVAVEGMVVVRSSRRRRFRDDDVRGPVGEVCDGRPARACRASRTGG